MGLEEIVAGIDKRKEQETSKLLSEARAEADRIMNEAKEKASSESKGIISKAEFEASQIKAREQSKANLEAKRLLYGSMSDKLSAAEAELRASISEYKNTEDYKALVLKLYSNALDALGNDCEVHAAKDDMQLIKKKFPKAKLYEAQEGFAFGLYANSSDGKMVIDYGLDSILSKVKDGFYSRLIKAINGKND
ncbi:V-type ATP synthase subunit E family protein [Candidatus Marsarchaeota archaeon]|nr:V-type ATP synthase subunit E family protein [Candidatus Marsarchaeota archaeon]